VAGGPAPSRYPCRISAASPCGDDADPSTQRTMCARHEAPPGDFNDGDWTRDDEQQRSNIGAAGEKVEVSWKAETHGATCQSIVGRRD